MFQTINKEDSTTEYDRVITPCLGPLSATGELHVPIRQVLNLCAEVSWLTPDKCFRSEMTYNTLMCRKPNN